MVASFSKRSFSSDNINLFELFLSRTSTRIFGFDTKLSLSKSKHFLPYGHAVKNMTEEELGGIV